MTNEIRDKTDIDTFVHRFEAGATAGGPDILSRLHNDHGNAERLIAMYGEDLRYCHAFRKWLVWDGMRWAVDDTDQSRRLGKQAMLEFLKLAIERGDNEKARSSRVHHSTPAASAACSRWLNAKFMSARPILTQTVRAEFPERYGRFAHQRTARTPAFGLHYEARSVQIRSVGGMFPMARVSGSGDGWRASRIGRRSRPLAALGGLPSAGAGLLAHWHDNRESRFHSVRHRRQRQEYDAQYLPESCGGIQPFASSGHADGAAGVE